MCRIEETVKQNWDKVAKFNKYLVFYSPEEEGRGIKGISSDAPPELIKEFIDWYRNTYRYENGRKRPLSDALVRKIVIDT